LDKTFKKYAKLDKKGAKQVIESLAVLVGKKLNHVRRGVEGEEITGATALSNYIDPNAQAKFYEHYGVPLPAYLAKKLGVGIDTKIEASGEPFLDSDTFDDASETLLEDTAVPLVPESMAEEPPEATEEAEPATSTEAEEPAEVDPTESPGAVEQEYSAEPNETGGSSKESEEPKIDVEDAEAKAEELERQQHELLLEKTKPTPLSRLAEELLTKHGDASLYV
jgi:hypothetical protein